MAQSLEELGSLTEDNGIPATLERQYNEALKSGAGKLWRGMMQVAASGFGKGLLVAAALLIGGMAFGAAYSAYAGFAVAGAVPTIGQGIVIGIGNALSFIASVPGVALLGVGGAVGAGAEVMREQGKINAKLAQVQSEQFKLRRDFGQDAELQQEASALTSKQPEKAQEPSFFTARETERRKAAAAAKTR